MSSVLVSCTINTYRLTDLFFHECIEVIISEKDTKFSLPDLVIQLTDAMIGQLRGRAFQEVLTKQS